MDNLNQPLNNNTNNTENNVSKPLVIVIILVVVAIVIAWQFTGEKTEPIAVTPAPVETPEPKPEPLVTAPEPITENISTPVTNEEILPPPLPTPLPSKAPLPTLDESDAWLKIKLPEITWRKELLTLIIDDDMIRRFVVFTDNFSQGNLAYEHSPFVLPSIKFSPNINVAPQGKNNTLQWSETSSKRFNLYVELLSSMDSDSLVQWYIEVKPLIDQAYSELGYDDDFTNTLQSAITRVLDMEIPKSSIALVQPSVMYKFADPQLEALPDADKLLLRLGKDNLLVIKSILLELHEKLAEQKNRGN